MIKSSLNFSFSFYFSESPSTEVGEKMTAMPIVMTIEQPTGCLMKLEATEAATGSKAASNSQN